MEYSLPRSVDKGSGIRVRGQRFGVVSEIIEMTIYIKLSLFIDNDIMIQEGIMASVVTEPHFVYGKINENGRIVIPAALRQQMGIKPGESVLMEVEDGVLRMESHRARIRRIQQEFRKHVSIKPGEMLMSDQLIAERREEARREMEETDLQIEEFRLRNAGQLG